MRRILHTLMLVMALIAVSVPAVNAQRHHGERGNNTRTERPKQSARPAGGSHSGGRGQSGRPAIGSGSHSRPGNVGNNNRPNKRPENVGNNSRPNNRPGNVGTSGRPAPGNQHGRPGNVGNGNHGDNKRPEGHHPGNVGNNNRPNNHPGNVGNNNRPNNRPGNVGTSGRPGVGNQHGRPGNVGNGNHRPGHHPEMGNRPGPGNNRPAVGPNRPGPNHRPGFGHNHRPAPRPPMIAPPHRPHRPVMMRPHYRPVPPPAWRPRAGIPVIRGILGLTFGVAFNASLDYLYNSGYSVDGYGNNIVYLRNVPVFNYMWTDGALYYGNGGLDASSFYYSTPVYDMSRYNSVYATLVNSYGMPVAVNNARGMMTSTWFGGNNGYITLTFGAGDGGRFLTTLTLGM